MFNHIFEILKKPKVAVLALGAIILLILGSLTSLMLPVFASSVIDDYFAKNLLDEKYLVLGLILVIVSFLLPLIQSYSHSVLSELIGYHLREKIIQHVLKQDISFLTSNYKSSRIFTIVTGDVDYIKNLLTQVFTSLMTAVVLIIGSLVMMFRLNTTLTIYILITIPVIGLFTILIFRNVAKLFKRMQLMRDRMNKKIDENIKAAMLVRVSVSEQEENRRFDKINMQFYNLGLSILKYIMFIFPTLNMILYIGQLIVIYFGGIQALNGQLSLGELSAFNGYIIIFTAPFLIIGFVSTLIGQAVASLNRINNILNTKPQKLHGNKTLSVFTHLAMKDVQLDVKDKTILEKINFEIKKGQKIGIIGLTGSGKSIFLQVLLKFFNDFKGEYKINGIDHKEIDFSSFRGLIGYVPQANFILDANIYDNIDFYRNLLEKDIAKAAQTSEIYEFASESKGGLELLAGERGQKLSGGQKQRITIARALADNPQILILDDSTSKLDSQTEAKIFQNIKKNYPEITLLIIAQKISSIKSSDRIYIMDEGSFASSGTHNELLNKSFLYQEIELSQGNYQEIL